MKPYLKSKPIALILALLVLSMPVSFAQQINYITDANGNLISGDNYYREYNEYNQLVKIRQGNLSTDPLLQEYFWHPVEERILEKRTYLTNGVLKERVLYISENYIVIENQSGRYNETYVYQDGTLIAQIDTNGNKQAMHSDHEGSSSLITDSNGNLVEITFYSPYGEILEGGKSSRFDYEGKEFDSAVQDYDFHFRKYNPSIPLFHQPDTLIQNVYDPQNLNRYAFERNNPYKYVDPDGHIYTLLIFPVLYAVQRGAAIVISRIPPDRMRGIAEIGVGLVRTGIEKSAEFIRLDSPLGKESIIGEGRNKVSSYVIEEQKKACSADSLSCSQKEENLRPIIQETKTNTPSSISQSSLDKTTNNDLNNKNQQSNLAGNPTSGSTSSGGGGGYVPGRGYVTPDGRTYPTKNPNWKPIGAPRYVPPPKPPKQSKPKKT